MKKFLAASTIVLALAGLSFGATARDYGCDAADSTNTAVNAAPCNGHYRHGSPLLRGLNLSDTQKGELATLRHQERADLQGKVRTLLTPDQQTIYDARVNHRGAHPLHDLNLTDAQKSQLKALFQQGRIDHQAKVRAILTPEQQATYDARINQWEARRNNRPN